MIFISGIISAIIQKNTLSKNKIRATYFGPNCVNFLPVNVHFFIFDGGADHLVIGIMLQTLDAKYLNEFKSNFVALTIFLKKSVILNYSLKI